MADEQYRWLDSDAAERLLRGEPLDAVGDDAREPAARLAEALAALAATTPPTSAELPGEAAALAAFRAVRADREQARAALGRPDPSHAADRVADAGLVRLGRSAANGRRARWGRPLRFGLATVAAAGMIGGVAVAAGTGVLPTPFQEEPGPTVSVSSATSPRHPLLTPAPGATETSGPVTPTPGATPGASASGGSSRDEAGGASAATPSPSTPGDGTYGRTRDWWTAVRSSCRDMAGGRELRADRLRDLQDAAGGSGRVKTFCKVMLADGEGGTGTGDGQGSGRDGDGGGDLGGSQGGDGGDGHHIWPGGNGLAGSPLGTPDPQVSALSP
ncbi:hypothetical protein [Streptomyces glomeratus]|uniref:Extensin n=1 Tax=Streptomyces glomeratus TaxID=284452 RepID=A0ABP6L403_9ACTN|nr:hypothetical protein [Streptomyces glomeratus]MCF1507261.1 hypothetical protein [Streptomyces glomeratus]